MAARASVADPRDRITEQAFRVDADLLGVPLAGGWRRLLALGVDLVLAAIFAELFGLVAFLIIALLLFRSSRRAQGATEQWTRRLRGMLVAAGLVALLFFAAAVVGLVGAAAWLSQNDPPWMALGTDTASTSTGSVSRKVAEVLDTLGIEARPSAGETGTVSIQLDDLIEALEGSTDAEGAAEALRELAETSTAALAQATAELRREAEAARAAREACEEEEARSEGFDGMTLAGGLLETFGLTFSWIGLYFTAFLALARGRTPGKWLLGMRVVRLDGRPLSLWASFERFSGYGAGLATGLLGFAQILWDDNRQAIHDKIVGTVVIRTGKPKLGVHGHRPSDGLSSD